MIADTKELENNIDEAVSYIQGISDLKPDIGIILGTGLHGLADHIDVQYTIDYEDIPHFPLSTLEFHKGKLLIGKMGHKTVVAMQGRVHYYEGYSFQEIVFPVRVMKFLGISTLIISNACGVMNPNFKKGHVMLIDDYINMLPGNPLIGPNSDKLGTRFPDMSEPYSQKLISLTEKIALEQEIQLFKGVYVAMPGPMLETRAEYRFLRNIGADVVGMSTVSETIAAKHLGLDVLGLSVMTDECFPDALKPAFLEEILKTAAKAEPALTTLIREVIKRL